PFSSLFANQVAYSGFPCACNLTNSKPVPASCSLACTKYLESVHSPAKSCVITSVPAEPVKPDVHAIHLYLSGKYSLICGSDEGMIYASIDRNSIAFLIADNRSLCDIIYT